MPASVPSLEGSLYLRDPQSVIAFQLRKFFRTPKEAMPYLDDAIISLPWLVAQAGGNIDQLVATMTSALQNVYDRIFGGNPQVTVAVTYVAHDNGSYDVTIAVLYTTAQSELGQTGITISLDNNGRLVIPEDTLQSLMPKGLPGS